MSARTRRLAVLSLLLGGVLAAAPDKEEMALHEKALADARVGTDGPALLAFFKQRTPTEEDKARLAAHVQALGSRSFAQREKAEKALLRAGRLSLQVLLRARQDPDVERARRAQRIVEEIESNSDVPLVISAAFVLAERRPAGAAE